MKMRNATEVVILVDPVQDYEESLEILGIYSSLDAAKAALPRIRRKPYPETAAAYPWNPDRVTEAQCWRGDTLVSITTFDPGRGGWLATTPGGAGR